MYPESGKIGTLNLIMYRGVKSKEEQFHKSFASDPGDYGCGEYWTDEREFAAVYGEVLTKEINLENVYHIPKEELSDLIKEYRTCAMEDGHEKRLENSMRLTADFQARGYDAVLTKGYLISHKAPPFSEAFLS